LRGDSEFSEMQNNLTLINTCLIRKNSKPNVTRKRQTHHWRSFPRWMTPRWNLSIPFVRFANLFFTTTKRHDDEERDVVAPPRRRNLLGWSTLFNFVQRSWNGILAVCQEGGPFVIWAPVTNLQANLLFPALPKEDPKTLPRRANGRMNERTNECGGGDGRLCASNVCDLCDDSSLPTPPRCNTSYEIPVRSLTKMPPHFFTASRAHRWQIVLSENMPQSECPLFRKSSSFHGFYKRNVRKRD